MNVHMRQTHDETRIGARWSSNTTAVALAVSPAALATERGGPGAPSVQQLNCGPRQAEKGESE
jgi:hypothetical protein